jgi:spermidine synthase
VRIEFPIRSDKLAMSVLAKSHVAGVDSAFQRIDVYDTDVFGRILLLDGHIQLTEFDEQAYHEALVWPALGSMKEPRSVLVVGGGDGGVAREVCRHPGIVQVDLVEIDPEVVAVCREHLPDVGAGAFDDPRVSLHIGDAFEFVQGGDNQYDLVVVDCTDVYEDEEGELSQMLFTDRFYSDVRRRLAPGGIVVTQADNPVFCPYSVEELARLFGRAFARTGSYWSLVPSFGGYSAFVWGSHGACPSPATGPAGARHWTPELAAAGFAPCPWPAR